MQARTTVSSQHHNLLLWLLAMLGVALLSFLPLSLLNRSPGDSPSALPGGSKLTRVAYLEFGRDADVLWVADAAYPERRQKLASLAHGAEFGIVPSIAPDHQRFAYTALPPAARTLGPATPADLWLAGIQRNARPRLVTRGIDLLIPAVWSRDGSALAVRRSAGAAQLLLLITLADGQERALVASNEVSLFPVGFAPDASSIYYVRLGREGSLLGAVDLATGEDREVARLAESLTRDWSLSPDATRLAYLAMSTDGSEIASRAQVLDLASGAVTTVAAAGDAFGPVWSAGGELAVGQIRESTDIAGGMLRLTLDGESRFASPPSGFDVPLSFAPEGDRIAVRSFEGNSTLAPGGSRLDVVGADGVRKTIAVGEVTFLGWTQ